MTIKFRKVFSILPFVNLNLSRSGISLTLGRRGLSANLNENGAKVTAGLPGSGLSYTNKLGRGHTKDS